MGTHIFDDISRIGALNAIDTARRLASRRFPDMGALEAALDALDIAETCIKSVAPVKKASRITRLRSSITGRFAKKTDVTPATSQMDTM